MGTLVSDFLDPEAWDKFVTAHAGPDGGLLQSWVWGELQRRVGRPVRRFALVDGGSPQAAWQITEHSLPFGQRYWYLARPALGAVNAALLAELVQQTKHHARRRRAVFLRLDAGTGVTWKNFAFRSARTKTAQPAVELIVDLRGSGEQFLAAMKQKTRYNIRLSQKHGVTVAEILPTADNVDEFFRLVSQTARRQGIRTYQKAYYETMVSVLTEARLGRLLLASCEGVPLATAFLAVFNGVVTYLHGGSASGRSEVMAPYALHWFAVQWAKQIGAHYYNFGGVSSANNSWAGITRFKQGFAPTTPFTEYGGTWELPVKPNFYHFYLVLQKMNHRTSDVRRKYGHRMSGK